MKKPYHIVNREEKCAAAAIEQFAISNDQLLLPLVELITQARIAVDEVIGSIGRKTIETILLLSAEEVAGARTPGKTSGEILWHGSQEGRVSLADRQLKVRRPRLSDADLEQEWSRSLARRADILGELVKVVSVPGGYYSRRVGRSAAAVGIEVSFNSEPTAAAAGLDGCLILGRYVVKRGMGPEWAAGFAAGRRGPRWKQAAEWHAKRVAKTLGGRVYLKLRETILAR